LDRLLSATNGTDTVSFGYDPAGNRLHHVINGYTTEYTYLPNNKLATAGEWTFTYDSSGNTVSKTSTTDQWSYQYDGGNNLTNVYHNGQSAGTYVYDGDGYRIKKTGWNSHSQQHETTIYLFSRGSVCYEKNTTTGLDAIYVYGPTGRLAKKAGDEPMYYHTDHLGSTRLLTDTTGSPVTAVEYSPFGKVEQSTGEPERYLFTGQEIDATGLYYYKARYYDPDTGRFLTQDKWADYRRPQSLNKYTYCVNNPLRYADPSGNVATFADEIIADMMAAKASEEPPSKVKGPQSDEGAYLVGYWLAFEYSYKMTPEIDPNEYNIQRKKMESIIFELFPDDPESRAQLMQGWDDGYLDGKKAYHEDSSGLLDTEVAALEQDVECLMDLASDQLIGVGENLGSFPESVDVLLTIVYIAEEMYNLTCTDKYGPPPDNLDELCRKEEEGTCSGTILLSILMGLAFLRISIQHKKRRFQQ
jgi:RHS repeat-associated protein